MLVKQAQNQHDLSEYSFAIPAGLVDSVLHGIHSTPFAAHLGVRRTILHPRNRFFWPQMQTHIKTFINNCHVCAQTKQGPHNDKAPLQSIDVNEPFVFWSMDYMGPLPETGRGNEHPLVITDHLTKRCEAFTTKDQKASTLAEILVSHVFSRFGPPATIDSDQGRNFESLNA